jgi:hypothetical protein
MANATGKFGLRPVRYLNGADWNGKARPYWMPAGDSTAVFIGDPVVIVGDSNDNQVEVVGGSFLPGSLSEIDIATGGDGNAIVGVVVGIMPSTQDSARYGAASTDRVILVADDPNIVYQVRDDGASALTADSVGLNAVLEAGAGGSTVTGLSSWMLDTDGDAPAADASNQVFILNLANLAGEENSLAINAVWEVLINTHVYSPHGGLGIA